MIGEVRRASFEVLASQGIRTFLPHRLDATSKFSARPAGAMSDFSSGPGCARAAFRQAKIHVKRTCWMTLQDAAPSECIACSWCFESAGCR